MPKEMSVAIASEEDIRESYGKINRWYPIAEWFERGVRNKALELFDAQGGEKILEIGPATGYASVELARRVGKIGKVYAIDKAPEMVELAQKRMEKEVLAGRVRLDEGDAREMPYRNDMFDGVYIATTLELFKTQDIPRVLKEIKRVLKPNGRLGVVSIPKEGHEDSKVLRFYKWLNEKFPKYINCRPIYVEDSIRDAGYKIIKTEEMMIAKLFPMKIVIAKP